MTGTLYVDGHDYDPLLTITNQRPDAARSLAEQMVANCNDIRKMEFYISDIWQWTATLVDGIVCYDNCA